MAEPRIGVYLCTCRGDISKWIDLKSVAEFVKKIKRVTELSLHEELCSREGQAFLQSEFKKGLSRVVVGACIPNITGLIMQKALEQAGLNKYLYEQVNIREQCAWVHSDIEKATAKAKSLLAGAIARATHLEALEDIEAKIVDKALVIGGGVAGMQAALEIANRGFKTYLVERTEELGGRAYKLSITFPTHPCGICCIQYCKECVFTPKVEDIFQNRNIEVMLRSEVKEVSGGFGNRLVKVSTPYGEREFDVGVIVVATGSKTFDPGKIPEYRYEDEDVITTMEIEHLIKIGYESGAGLKRPSNGEIPKTVNFILCVGSRDRSKGNIHCSLVCCTYGIGMAREIKKLHPDTDVYIHYIDLRGPYRGFEEFYEQAKAEGIKFVRGRVAEINRTGDKLLLRAEDVDLGSFLEIESDLVILAIGQEPSEGNEHLVRMLRLHTDEDRFIRDMNPLFPEEFRRGIYMAGCAIGPKGIRYSIEEAKDVANRAVELMRRGTIRSMNLTAVIDENRCIGCGRCKEICEFGAIELKRIDGSLKSQMDKVRCEGCGACAVACCNRAIMMSHFKREQMVPMIKAMVRGEINV
jgi:heterodisulfide reductase subunit A